MRCVRRISCRGIKFQPMTSWRTAINARVVLTTSSEVIYSHDRQTSLMSMATIKQKRRFLCGTHEQNHACRQTATTLGHKIFH